MIKILITLLLLPVFVIGQKDTMLANPIYYIGVNPNGDTVHIEPEPNFNDPSWQCDHDTTTSNQFYDHFYNYMPTFYDDFEWNWERDLFVMIKPKNYLYA